jgi:predicted transcriptional regulator
MAKTWEEVRSTLDFTPEDEAIIAMEKDLLCTMARIREEKGLSQKQLAKLCHVKQPAIARMETSTHSPRLDSLLKILVPMGYTLKIEKMER